MEHAALSCPIISRMQKKAGPAIALERRQQKCMRVKRDNSSIVEHESVCH